MKKTSQSKNDIGKKSSPAELKKLERQMAEHDKRAWTWWERQDEPVMKFLHCANEIWAKDVLNHESEHIFEDIPDFFQSKAFTELYFDMLSKCAEHHSEAARRLHYIATFAVKHLNDAAYAAPKYFQQIAQEDFLWPGYLSDHPDVEKEQKKGLFSKLHLGEKCPIRVKGKKFSLDTLETRIAFQLWGKIEFVRKDENTLLPINWAILEKIKYDAAKLTPLSRENYRLWWKVGEKLFLLVYGEQFENDKSFTHYWKNAAYKDEQNARALIRRDIKKKIQQGFRSIAVKSSAGENELLDSR